MTDAETKQAVGRKAGIMEKSGGWVEVHVELPGKQYPLKLSTKLEPLIEKVRGLGDEIATFTYKEVDSGNPNPHKPGTNYINRYLDSVEAGATAPPPSAMTKAEWAQKDKAIHKDSIIKAAMGALQHTVPSDPSDADLSKFIQRVLYIAGPLHANVVSEREGDEPPF